MSLPFRIGKSAMENSMLVMQSDNEDVWFHINGLPSAHLVYFNPDRMSLDKLRTKKIIYQMALELKKSSKYKKLPHVEVIYSYVKNVSPTAKPGLVRVKETKVITV